MLRHVETPGPCAHCGKETTQVHDEYNGFSYHCEDHPAPRQVQPHTPGWYIPPKPTTGAEHA